MKKLFRENIWKLIVSTVVILLPMILWFLGQNEMLFPLLVIPPIMVAIHWICVTFTFWDNAKRGQNAKTLRMMFWILPIISNYVSATIYASTKGFNISVPIVVSALMGAMFIIIGNYLPKCKRNRTMGIKVKWALESDDNWYATHRFTGRLWVILGVAVLACSFLPEKIFLIAMVASIAPAVIIPIIYSYLFYKKQVKEGSFKRAEDVDDAAWGKKSSVFAVVLLILIGLFVVFVLFSGGFEVALDEDSIFVDASMHSDIDVKYADIDSIEYRDNDDAGKRVVGFGAPNLLMGSFSNQEFGSYTRYSHGTANGCVVIKSGEKIYVIGCEDKAATKALYEAISAKIGE